METGAGPFACCVIANRGEIAVRIARACRELGLPAVALYSDADRDALHVQVADLAARIGPPPASESYLNVEAIIQAATRFRSETGAIAVHPGYGFLSERAEFAAACREAGLVFVGPPPEAIRAMGDKVHAKRLMREAGVPVVPGWEGESDDLDQVYAAALTLPMPLMVKAAAGGGGRGMRVVREPGGLMEALEGARREALAAFGDGRLFVERLIERPRHVEIQVLADGHGSVIHLGERECSIQRRHQKIVEESPSPAVTPELRAEMGEAAVRAARAVGYVNAGTVEFILDQAGNYYFLEMNTRLQVEHPVTELVTGLDLVHLQLRIAAGEPLPIRQEDVTLRGHAVECRIYAEDPAAGFLPSTGKLLVFSPPTAPGVRNDVGYYPGAEVTPYYDPMLAKLIVHAPDRDAAIDRASAALRDYGVLGVQANVSLLLGILAEPEFHCGETATDFLDRHALVSAGARRAWTPAEAVWHAAAAELLDGTDRFTDATGPGVQPPDPWAAGAWRDAATWRVLRLRWQDEERALLARRPADAPDEWRVRSEGQPDVTTVLPRRESGVRVVESSGNRQRLFVARSGSTVLVGKAGRVWEFSRVRTADEAGERERHGRAADEVSLAAPMPGRVVKLNVAEGDAVRAQQTLLVLEAMKMEHAVVAPYDGVVRRLPFRVGEMAPKGAALVELEET